MLKTKKSVTLNGEVLINEKLAVTLNASITAETAGNSYISQSVVDQELYNSNRKECREDIRNFQEEVFKLEDTYLTEEEATE